MNAIMFTITILTIVISMPLVFAESIDVELDESLNMSTEDEKPKQTKELHPLKQIKEGTEPQDIQCKSSMELIFKYSGEPSCVKLTSVEKLINRGWTR